MALSPSESACARWALTTTADLMLLHLGVQLRSTNTELSRSFGSIAVRALECAHDHAAFELSDSLTKRNRFFGDVVTCARSRISHRLRQIDEVDHFATAQCSGALNDMDELSHIARPLINQKP